MSVALSLPFNINLMRFRLSVSMVPRIPQEINNYLLNGKKRICSKNRLKKKKNKKQQASVTALVCAEPQRLWRGRCDIWLPLTVLSGRNVPHPWWKDGAEQMCYGLWPAVSTLQESCCSHLPMHTVTTSLSLMRVLPNSERASSLSSMWQSHNPPRALHATRNNTKF